MSCPAAEVLVVRYWVPVLSIAIELVSVAGVIITVPEEPAFISGELVPKVSLSVLTVMVPFAPLV